MHMYDENRAVREKPDRRIYAHTKKNASSRARGAILKHIPQKMCALLSLSGSQSQSHGHKHALLRACRNRMSATFLLHCKFVGRLDGS